MRSVPDSPVFTREQARALGWSDAAISRALASGKLIKVRRGLFARPGIVDERIAALAAACSVAGSVVSHRSAAILHDLPIVGPRPDVPELTVPPTGTGSAHAARLHRATLGPGDVVEVDGVPVTSVARTLVDLGRTRPVMSAVAAYDAALHRRLVTVEQITDVLVRCWNWPRIPRARRALDLADSRAESALESVSRLVIRSLRLPPPDLQTLVVDRYGAVPAWLDFYWEKWGVAGEADGRSKYVDREVLTSEKERQEHFEDEQLVFVRWGWKQAMYQRPVLRARLLSGFQRGLARDRSGLPRHWSVISR